MSNYQRVGRVVHHCNRAAGLSLSLSLSLSRVAPAGPRGFASTSSPAAIRPAALLFDRGKSIRGGSVNAGGVATPHMLTGRIASPHGNYSEARRTRLSWRLSTQIYRQVRGSPCRGIPQPGRRRRRQQHCSPAAGGSFFSPLSRLSQAEREKLP